MKTSNMSATPFFLLTRHLALVAKGETTEMPGLIEMLHESDVIARYSGLI